MSEVIKDIGTAFAGAFFGALFAVLIAYWQERRNRRVQTTRDVIEEFFSAEFLKHRVAVAELRRKVLAGRPSIPQIACGYWYPGGQDCYTGEMLGVFNEHQHLEMFLGFVTRLAHASSTGIIDRERVRLTLKSSYLWHADILSVLATEVRAQVNGNSKMAELPAWVSAVEQVNELMEFDPSINHMVSTMAASSVEPDIARGAPATGRP